MAAILQGLASDGGLLMPEKPLRLAPHQGAYRQMAAQVLTMAFGEDYGEAPLSDLAEEAYGQGAFDAPEVVPLRPVGPYHVLELFRGPTASFKDIALGALPRLMALARQRLMPERQILVLTATSGDTGSATMAGFRDIPGIKVIVFYPEHGVSPVQAAQMQRMAGDNLRAVAIRGDFDQAQRGVKHIFQQADSIAPQLLLSSANSINIGRLIPQMAYYLSALNLLDKQARPVFAVPTGNFGDILAGSLALAASGREAELICATNANSVLDTALQQGVYDRRRPLIKTLSPSMDILVSSNFERALYLACEGDSARLADMMRHLEQDGRLELPPDIRQRLRQRYDSAVCDDAQALRTMGEVFGAHQYLLDPHSAAAWQALDSRLRPRQQGVALATASPFKFPEAALRALRQPVPDEPAEQLQALSAAAGLPIPRSLEGLFARDALHEEVIDPQQMADYVARRARTW